MKEIASVNFNDRFHARLHHLGEHPTQEAWNKPYSSFIGISLMAVPFSVRLPFFQNYRKLKGQFQRNEKASDSAFPKLHGSFPFHLSLRFSFLHLVFPLASTVAFRCKGMAAGFGNKRSSLRFSENLHTALRLGCICFEKPCISSLVALEKHLKRNDRCDKKTQKKCRKGSDKEVKKRELPFCSWNRKSF